jgi:hypothetical protein
VTASDTRAWLRQLGPVDTRGRPRASIRLTDGRLTWGRSPGLTKIRGQDEAELNNRRKGVPATEAIAEYRRRDQLAEQLGGIVEVWGPAGRADVVTTTAVFEVKRWRLWEQGLQQVIGYAAQFGLPPALAVFGALSEENMLKAFNRLRAIKLYGLRQADSVQLWWWSGVRWERIVSAEQCRAMPDGIRFGECASCGRPIARFEDDVWAHAPFSTRGWNIYCKPLADHRRQSLKRRGISARPRSTPKP